MLTEVKEKSKIFTKKIIPTGKNLKIQQRKFYFLTDVINN